MIRDLLTASLAALLLMGCATSSVDLTEPRRVLGRADDVRLDGQIFEEVLQPGGSVRMVWDVTNERSTPIAIADVVPMVEIDGDSTLTVQFGSEVPGNELLPRLVRIAPGEKRSFSMAARLPTATETGSSISRPMPRQIRLQLTYLGDVAPFEELIDIPERAVNDPVRADELFDAWVEATRTVTTNALPVTWRNSYDPVNASSRRPGR